MGSMLEPQASTAHAASVHWHCVDMLRLSQLLSPLSGPTTRRSMAAAVPPPPPPLCYTSVRLRPAGAARAGGPAAAPGAVPAAVACFALAAPLPASLRGRLLLAAALLRLRAGAGRRHMYHDATDLHGNMAGESGR